MSEKEHEKLKGERLFAAKVTFVCKRKEEIEAILKKINQVLDEMPNEMHWIEEAPAYLKEGESR